MSSDEVSDFSLYGGVDPRNLPRYSYVEAAKATRVPASTIAAWVRGQHYTRSDGRDGFFSPVIDRPGEGHLSFYNLIEVHVLRSLRTKHAIKLQHVREAAAIAEKEYNLPKLLLSEQLRFGAGDLFLERYGEIVQLSRAEQLAMSHLLYSYLERIEFDHGGLPRDFFPLQRLTPTAEKVILVSPAVSFGRPVVQRVGVTTRAIAERINVGESEEAVIEDYGLESREFQDALAYETLVAA